MLLQNADKPLLDFNWTFLITCAGNTVDRDQVHVAQSSFQTAGQFPSASLGVIDAPDHGIFVGNAAARHLCIMAARFEQFFH